MSLHRRAAKRDDNERPIIDALEKCGCSVHQMRDGVDLLVCRAGKLFLLECKARLGKLTDAQRRFRHRFPFAIVRSPADALRAVGFVDHQARAEVNGARARRAIDDEVARLMEGV